MPLGNPVVTKIGNDALQIETATQAGESFRIIFREDSFEVINSGKECVWGLELKTASGIKLPFVSIENQKIQAKFDGFEYTVKILEGSFEKPAENNKDYVFRIRPANGKIRLDCKNGK
ncbi:MAG: hypothetical protein LBQ54_01130 [Planctomycetaceae bacterium]|nr:hypothetical protein [Planctomycetaceae bacterium]